MAESQTLFIDPALRSGHFDHEIYIDFPDESARVDILSVLTKNLKVEGALDIVKIAKSTPGFVGADLEALTQNAGFEAMNRLACQLRSKGSIEGELVEDWWKQRLSHEEIEKHYVIMADFEEAAKKIQPASIREGFLTIPKVKLEDVGGLQLLKDVFDRHIVRRIKFPQDYEECGVDLETRFLLFGPPGCGKTLIANAVAGEVGASFIHIKGFGLLHKYVENELAVRKIFNCAMACSPCILFFDELEYLTTRCGREGGGVVEQLLDKLLIELDGAHQRKGVYVIGATRSPEFKDLDLLQPRRFWKLLYVPLPSPYERGLILTALGRKKRIDANVDLMAIASERAYTNFSGAGLAALMNGAAMAALEDKWKSGNEVSGTQPWTIKEVHFKQAPSRTSPSVSDAEIRKYEHLSESFIAASERT